MAMKKTIENLKNHYRYIKEVYHGSIVLKKIKKQYEKKIIICVSQHPAIGDAYLAGLYLNTYYGREQFVVTAISPGSIEVYRYLNISYVYRLTQKETDHIIQYCQFMGIADDKVKILHHQPLKWHTGIAWYFHGIHGLNFADIFEAVVFPGMSREDRNYPVIQKNCDRDYETVLQKENSVIIFPYANTLYTPGSDYWIDIIQHLNKKGYCVATYIHDNEEPIENSIGVTCKLAELVSLVEYAGCFISVRNGLSDIISRAKCRKIVLYPTTGAETWIHGKIMDFWSLNGFGYGNNIEEYEWGNFKENGLKYEF